MAWSWVLANPMPRTPAMRRLLVETSLSPRHRFDLLGY
jgi:hypothetical protein